MFKKQSVTCQGDIGDKWRDRLVVIWEGDDAPVPDKERVDSAFRRISGFSTGYHKPVLKVDEGDEFVYFYREGWVKAVDCEGGWVGVLLKASK